MADYFDETNTERDALIRVLNAARIVLAGLNHRIEVAAASGEEAPVFVGIAELHNAIAALGPPDVIPPEDA